VKQDNFHASRGLPRRQIRAPAGCLSHLSYRNTMLDERSDAKYTVVVDFVYVPLGAGSRQMQRFGVILTLALLATLSGCDHVMSPQPAAAPVPAPVASRSIPDPAVVQQTFDLDPAELASVMKMVDLLDRGIASGAYQLPHMEHPLDGLSRDQIEEMFAAVGLRAESHLP
jgi:hypothetical protein